MCGWLKERQYEWLDVAIAIGAVAAMSGLLVWMVWAPAAWTNIPRYLCLLPVGLITYRFGRRMGWIAAALGAVLIFFSLVKVFAHEGLSPQVLDLSLIHI